MKSLKQIINRYIRSAAIVMALVILVVIAFAEILIEQGRVEDTAAGTFVCLEQMALFAPMLTDKSLQLVQDAGPNTAEGKNMQYSAVWSAFWKRVQAILTPW
ncbi:MAG: hypothetical protein PUB27_06560 [Firmicutes bacterium]|nr:hypothetical protein [Bacillota bacterium]